MNKKIIKTKIMMIVGFLLIIAGSISPKEAFAEEVFNKNTFEYSRPIQNSQIPHLAFLSIEHFDNYFPIKVVESLSITDSAQAARVYTEFDKTEQCLISINPNAQKGLKQERISAEKLELFVYLHEIAHCADAEPAPPGVNKDDWLEALADGYAAAIMLQNHSLTISQLSNLSNFRNRTQNKGAAMMNYYLSRSENNPANWEKHSEQEILDEVKRIRREIFKS